MMRVHRVKGLWLGVIKSIGETNLEVNRVETNLKVKRVETNVDLNQGE